MGLSTAEIRTAALPVLDEAGHPSGQFTTLGVIRYLADRPTD
jgi:hypothetical protein